MTLETFTALLDQLDGIEELHLQGLGEPLLNPDFFSMVRLAASRGVRVTTSSNLLILSEHLAEEIVISGLFCIHVSVDGATAPTHERMRAGGSLPKVLKNIGLLSRAREKTGKSLPHLRMTTVLTRTNLQEIPLLVELAGQYGMEEVFVQGLCHALGDYSLPAAYQSLRIRMQEQDYLQEAAERIEELMADAVNRAQSLNMSLRLPRFRRSQEDVQQVCDWPHKGVYVTYRGHVTPCCMIPTSDRIMFGDATATPLQEIWNSEAYQSFRRKLASKHPPEMCCECAIYLGTF
jgi:radical SAM protein with 4Fe4S-binding SPASM domain